jgi:hypothetical protein
MADVAQLVRAPGCGSGGRGFDPRRLPQITLSSMLGRVCNSALTFSKTLDTEIVLIFAKREGTITNRAQQLVTTLRQAQGSHQQQC